MFLEVCLCCISGNAGTQVAWSMLQLRGACTPLANCRLWAKSNYSYVAIDVDYASFFVDTLQIRSVVVIINLLRQRMM